MHEQTNERPVTAGSIASENWQQFHATQLARIRKGEQRAVERASAYPSSFAAYAELPLTERMSAAKSILIYESPTVGRSNSAMPEKALRFDISHLVDSQADTVEARIAYAEGAWTNAVNSTYIDEQAHVKIQITTTVDQVKSTDDFARLVCDGWDKPVFYAKAHNTTIDPEALLQDVATIIDTGIGQLYEQKLTSRIQKLGALAINDTTGEQA